jgi:hypothetical protein
VLDPPFTLVGEWFNGVDSRFVSVRGGTAIVVDMDELHILDVSNPSSVRELGRADHWANYVSGAGVVQNAVVVVGAPDEFIVVDVSDASEPVVIADVKRPLAWGENYLAVAISDHVAYVGTEDGDFFTVDLSNPAEPRILGELSRQDLGSSDIGAIEVYGDVAYVADSDAGIRMVDVSDPSGPFRISDDSTLGHVQDLEVLGDRLYALTWDAQPVGTLRIMDLADSRSPVTRGWVDVPSPYSLAIRGTFAYVGTMQDGLAVFDISDPGIPVEVARLDVRDLVYGSGRVRSIDVVDDLVYFVNSGGMHIVRFDRVSVDAQREGASHLPEAFSVDAVYPNPVRGAARAAYRVADHSVVRISVIDLLGREVLRVMDGHRPAGPHEVTIDGAGLRSGVYLLQVEAGNARRTRTFVVLR